MPQQWRQVEQWRERAEEIRAAADSFTVPSARQRMLMLAESYERLADEVERRLLHQQVANPEAG